MENSPLLMVFSLFGEWSNYIVIILTIAAFVSGLVWIAIKFLILVVQSMKWSRQPHTIDQHFDRYAFLAGYSKEDLQPEPGPEQVAERPHVELKFDDEEHVFEWDDWGNKSKIKQA